MRESTPNDYYGTVRREFPREENLRLYARACLSNPLQSAVLRAPENLQHGTIRSWVFASSLLTLSQEESESILTDWWGYIWI